MAVCYHFATGRLFRGFYGTADRGVNLLGSIRLYSRHDVAVKVRVMPIDECPRRSLATSGWTPAAGNC
jgi:hypothetical protein